MIQPFRKIWFLLGLVVSNSGQTTERVWSALPNNTGDFCPFVDICVWKAKADTASKPVSVPCCKECSCEDSCGLDGNCCFPKLDTYKLADRSLQSCTYDHTPLVEKEGLHLFKSYYMVNKNPRGGCYKTNKYDDLGEECGNMQVAPWGSLYPAFSKQTGKIFRNMRCAECHGTNDAKLWNVFVNCNSRSNIYGLNSRMLQSNDCYVEFKYEKYLKKLKQEQCYNDVIDYCDPLVILDASIDLSRNEIETACTSGFFSPYNYKGSYANVFCYLCNGWGYTAECAEDNRRGGRYSMISLIDFTVIEALQSPKRQSLACRTRTTNEYVSDCRPVHCPTGKIRIADTCKYTSKVVYKSSYGVVIRLVPADNTTLLSTTVFEELISGKKHGGSMADWIGLLWDEKWKITSIYYGITTSANISFVKEYFVNMLYEPYSVNPESFFSEVQKNLDQQTEIGTGMVVNQKLARRVSLKNIIEGNLTGSTTGLITDRAFFAYSNKNNRLKYRITIITKMFFCEQIDLKESEYVAYADFHLIYYKARDVFFYEGEFSISVDTISDNKTVRICLSDSGYVDATNGAVAFVQLIFWVCVRTLTVLNVIDI